MLAPLAGRDCHGLDIARKLTTDGVLMSSEGTLDPLLARPPTAGSSA